MHWFPKDYRADPLVMGMTDDQDLAYRRMIDTSWEVGPLPPDPKRIAQLIRFDPDRFAAAWCYPLTDCWKKGEKGLTNPRLERERRRAQNFHKLQTSKSRAGVKARKAKKGNNDTLESADNPRVNHRSTPPDPYPDPEEDLLAQESSSTSATTRISKPKSAKSKAGKSELASETARAYLAVLSAVSGRRLRVLSDDVVRSTEARLREWKPWQIVALPVVLAAQGSTLTHSPDVYLRNGEHPRTRNGNTYGGFYWLARTFEKADGTKLDERLESIAMQAGVLHELQALGVGGAS